MCTNGGRPCGGAVKCARSVAATWDSQVLIPGVHRCTTCQAMLWRHPMWSRGRWAQMLAQGQSSLDKREGLASDGNSGRIFLIKKKGRPRGLALKCALSAAGGPGSDPGHAPTHRFYGHAEAVSHIQQLEGCAAMTYNYLLWLWGKKCAHMNEDWKKTVDNEQR